MAIKILGVLIGLSLLKEVSLNRSPLLFFEFIVRLNCNFFYTQFVNGSASCKYYPNGNSQYYYTT